MVCQYVLIKPEYMTKKEECVIVWHRPSAADDAYEPGCPTHDTSRPTLFTSRPVKSHSRPTLGDSRGTSPHHGTMPIPTRERL